MNALARHRLLAFMIKETIQAYRDPSTFLIAIVLPLMMIFLFAYGVSLDTNTIKVGLVLEDNSPESQSLAHAFMNTRYFKVTVGLDRKEIEQKVNDSKLRGFIVIPEDFSEKLGNNQISPIQVIADGSETNTASFVQNYAQGVVANWWQNWQREQGMSVVTPIDSQTRVWFNPELKSRNVILPGSIAIIMALIGTLLTALVVAREWERGTMEAVLASPIKMSELIIGKMLPYYFLGMSSMILCVLMAVIFFDVPFVGSVWVMLLGASLFLLAGLSQGLLISIIAKNQFVASQAAINIAFLPAYMLSGFLYEIQAMPLPLRAITYLFPPRYFVSVIQTNFLAGVVWSRLLPDLIAMLIIGMFFLWLVSRKCKKSLE